MARRRKVNKRSSSRKFSKSVRKTNRRNVAKPMRGGFRL